MMSVLSLKAFTIPMYVRNVREAQPAEKQDGADVGVV